MTAREMRLGCRYVATVTTRLLGLALCGEAETRLAERVAVPISADTLLRMAASALSSESPAPTPRILAVDDWARLAKVPSAQPLESQTRAGVAAIATEPVNLERNEVVDLLPDRQAETLAARLREHTGVSSVRILTSAC